MTATNRVFPAQAPSSTRVTAGGLASLILFLVAGAVLLFLLWRTEHNAVEIRKAAASIAENGRGINASTDSILQLNKTNELGASILDSATPLHSALTQINQLAADIDGVASSIQNNAVGIDNSATSIRGSATTIKGQVDKVNSVASTIAKTATGINGDAANILKSATAIERGAKLINSNASTTNGIAQAILADAKGISGGLEVTNGWAGRIDHSVNGTGVLNGLLP